MTDTRALLAGVLAGLVGLIVGAWWGSSTHEATGSTEAEVRALLDAQAKAWSDRDLDGFMAGYIDDGSLTYHSGGKLIIGFPALRAHYQTAYQAPGREMGRLTFTDLHVEDLGDGWATARGQWNLEKKEPAGGLFILMLRHTPAGWRVVHDHTSADVKTKPE